MILHRFCLGCVALTQGGCFTKWSGYVCMPIDSEPHIILMQQLKRFSCQKSLTSFTNFHSLNRGQSNNNLIYRATHALLACETFQAYFSHSRCALLIDFTDIFYLLMSLQYLICGGIPKKSFNINNLPLNSSRKFLST